VSGGSAKRFDSIFAAIEQHAPELFVVSDLSRWTRDRPSRFWAIKALLEDQGVQLVSVDESYLGGDMPFSDTITTAQVEMNYQERMRLKVKTSAGLKRAWAAGKRWGYAFGWSFTDGKWSQDAPLIARFYQDWLDGVTSYEMARRYGMFEQNVRKAISARAQRDVVGDEMWERAQVPRIRKASGSTMQHANHWGHYRCVKSHLSPHPWRQLSAPRWVAPELHRVLSMLSEPEGAFTPPPTVPQTIVDYDAEIEKLSLAFARGRLSQATWETQTSKLEQLKNESQSFSPRPAEELLSYVNDLSIIDLDDRDPETGNIANRLIRHVVDRIELSPDRTPNVVLMDDVLDWIHKYQ
jgi:DNA invertase Pin-like site-specific DNA recombinase